MKSYHDFHIHGYEVDSVGRKINFKLAWPEENGNASIVNVLFECVYGYELRKRGQTRIKTK
jgi:hypothetical protein